MKKIKFLFLTVLIFLTSTLFAEKPEWINRLPYTKDAFWGIGEGTSLEEAKVLAKRDILIQLSSHIEAVLTMETRSDGDERKVSENFETFLSNSSLNGAELEDTYEKNGRYWALMKYCDECGKILIHTALTRYEQNNDYNSKELMDRLSDGKVSEALMIERRLKELRLEDYRSEDIKIALSGKQLIIRVINFLPFKTELTESQQAGLVLLSETLLKELEQLNYKSIDITGHANPMGKENEMEELYDLSQNRAETLASYLEIAGLRVDKVNWKGGDEIIGDTETLEGRGKNRRVEIFVNFE